MSPWGSNEAAGLVNAFKRGLHELGYVEGQDIAFEIRSAEGYYDRLASLATELASLHVAVIFADTTVAIQAAKQATHEIPIVSHATNQGAQRRRLRA